MRVCVYVVLVYERQTVRDRGREKTSRVQWREVGSAQSPGTRPAGQQMREQLSVWAASTEGNRAYAKPHPTPLIHTRTHKLIYSTHIPGWPPWHGGTGGSICLLSTPSVNWEKGAGHAWTWVCVCSISFLQKSLQKLSGMYEWTYTWLDSVLQFLDGGVSLRQSSRVIVLLALALLCRNELSLPGFSHFYFLPLRLQPTAALQPTLKSIT